LKKTIAFTVLAAACLGIGARAADPVSTGSVHLRAVTYRGDNSSYDTLHGMADVQIHYSNPSLPAGTVVEWIGGYGNGVHTSMGGYAMSSKKVAGWHTGLAATAPPTDAASNWFGFSQGHSRSVAKVDPAGGFVVDLPAQAIAAEQRLSHGNIEEWNLRQLQFVFKLKLPDGRVIIDNGGKSPYGYYGTDMKFFGMDAQPRAQSQWAAQPVHPVDAQAAPTGYPVEEVKLSAGRAAVPTSCDNPMSRLAI
jgi:hypothetical protein